MSISSISHALSAQSSNSKSSAAKSHEDRIYESYKSRLDKLKEKDEKSFDKALESLGKQAERLSESSGVRGVYGRALERVVSHYQGGESSGANASKRGRDSVELSSQSSQGLSKSERKIFDQQVAYLKSYGDKYGKDKLDAVVKNYENRADTYNKYADRLEKSNSQAAEKYRSYGKVFAAVADHFQGSKEAEKKTEVSTKSGSAIDKKLSGLQKQSAGTYDKLGKQLSELRERDVSGKFADRLDKEGKRIDRRAERSEKVLSAVENRLTKLTENNKGGKNDEKIAKLEERLEKFKANEEKFATKSEKRLNRIADKLGQVNRAAEAADAVGERFSGLREQSAATYEHLGHQLFVVIRLAAKGKFAAKTNKEATRIEKRAERSEKVLSAIEKRLTRLTGNNGNGKHDEKIAKLEKRLEKFIAKEEKFAANSEKRLNKIADKLGGVDAGGGGVDPVDDSGIDPGDGGVDPVDDSGIGPGNGGVDPVDDSGGDGEPDDIGAPAPPPKPDAGGLSGSGSGNNALIESLTAQLASLSAQLVELQGEIGDLAEQKSEKVSGQATSVIKAVLQNGFSSGNASTSSLRNINVALKIAQNGQGLFNLGGGGSDGNQLLSQLTTQLSALALQGTKARNPYSSFGGFQAGSLGNTGANKSFNLLA